MRALLATLLLAGLAAAGGPFRPDPESVEAGLRARERHAREDAVAATRKWAQTDPAAVAALGRKLDLGARCLLVRALASAGSRRAAAAAWSFANDREPEVFQALLLGLVDGGSTALFTPIPVSAKLTKRRRAAIEEVRLRWRVEEELVRLKSPTGPTGHYKGQYKRLKALLPHAIPILLDITADRARPLPGEGAVGRYRIVHPAMAHFESTELRTLTAYAFGELVSMDDVATKRALRDLFLEYRSRRHERQDTFEYNDLGPAIAYSLHDLGWKSFALRYIREIEADATGNDFMSITKAWEAGFANIRIGRYAEGEKWYEYVLRYAPNRAIAAYNMACHFSTRARDDRSRAEEFTDRALGYLERAILRHNYSDWVWMEEDGDLAYIRKHPRYQSLLLRLKTKYPARKKGKVAKELKDFVIPPK